MKPFYFKHRRNRLNGGFNLVEAVLSLGVLSFGFLALVPLLAVGSKAARQARDNEATTQIAETLIEDAKQGRLSSDPIYLDAQGNPCPQLEAIYKVQTQTASSSIPDNATAESGAPERLTLRITPTGAPDRARTYAVVFSAP